MASKKTGIPAVLVLLVTGMLVRQYLIHENVWVDIPKKVVQLFGILGLIMIVLEAGLDLQLSRKKLKLVRNTFLSALIILALSSTACAILLHRDLGEDYLRCFIYAIPLSIVSSAIVIPSISHLQENKKEFLKYETSISDILGIVVADFRIDGQGKLRFQLSKEDLSVTSRLRFNWMINTDKEHMAGFRYVITKYISASTHHNSDMGIGVGAIFSY